MSDVKRYFVGKLQLVDEQSTLRCDTDVPVYLAADYECLERELEQQTKSADDWRNAHKNDDDQVNVCLHNRIQQLEREVEALRAAVVRMKKADEALEDCPEASVAFEFGNAFLALWDLVKPSLLAGRAMFKQAMELHPDRPEHHEAKAQKVKP